MVSRSLMNLWERRGRTFGERSNLVHRADVIRGVMEESLHFLQGISGVVLDVGCGDGIPTVSLVKYHQVIGVDFTSTMLLRAKSNLPSADLLRGSINHLPLRSGSMPAVTCFFVLSDYYNPINIVSELGRVLQPQGRIILADYSSNDDFNNLLDDLQIRILGKDRGMFRLNPEAMRMLAEKSGLKVDAFKELHYRLTLSLDTFINQLYFSSVGPQYRERRLSDNEWRMFLGGWLKESELQLMRRFVLVLAEKAS
jgi:SAM-dependent methyltransferase